MTELTDNEVCRVAGGWEWPPAADLWALDRFFATLSEWMKIA